MIRRDQLQRVQNPYIRACAAAVVVLCAYASAVPAQDRAPDYAAIIAATDRSDADRQTDARRDPMKLLVFAAPRPGMKVLDMGAVLRTPAASSGCAARQSAGRHRCGRSPQ